MALSIDQSEATDLRSVNTVQELIDLDDDRREDLQC